MVLGGYFGGGIGATLRMMELPGLVPEVGCVSIPLAGTTPQQYDHQDDSMDTKILRPICTIPNNILPIFPIGRSDLFAIGGIVRDGGFFRRVAQTAVDGVVVRL